MKGRIQVAALAALAMLTSISGTAAGARPRGCRGASLRPARANVASVAKATLCLINQVRRANRLKPVRMNSSLRAIASGQSHDMLIGGYFGDNSLSGLTPMQRIEASPFARGRHISVGQNIAWGEEGESTPTSIVEAWMGSPPHREILLSRAYRMAGIGIGIGAIPSTGRRMAAIYTLDLATRGAKRR